MGESLKCPVEGCGARVVVREVRNYRGVLTPRYQCVAYENHEWDHMGEPVLRIVDVVVREGRRRGD